MVNTEFELSAMLAILLKLLARSYLLGIGLFCPWCILDSSVAKRYDGEFQDVDSFEEVDNEEYIDELIHRTLGYVGWQQEYWLSHCGGFCAIVQYVGWEEIKDLENELDDDINNICLKYGLTRQELQNGLLLLCQFYLE